MAPDANKLRQRNVATADKTEDNATEPTDRIATLKGLRETEICIDGVMYDIGDFDHPGGESIHMFGGNDVTIQYKMIHPYHTRHHLEKMKRVGTVPDYTSEYKFDTEFEREIKREVFKIVKRGREFGTWGWHLRAVFYTCLFFGLQFLWMTTPATFALAIFYGISQSLIGLNVQHDANHGAASKTPWINNMYGLGADFIGGSKWLWMEQHWTHHSFTNHWAKDSDALGAEPMILFNDYEPDHPKRADIHKLQALYVPFVLAGYWMSTVFNPQILNLRHQGSWDIGYNWENSYLKKSRKYAIGLRVLYIYCNIIAPFRASGLSFDTLIKIMVMGIAESLCLSALFALSHNFEDSNRDPTYQARTTGEPVDWFKAQVETSSTYGGLVAGCMTGGLNFQVEHHLFPRMSSGWYPFIAPTVRRICKKHNVNYAYYPYIWQNMISTFRYLHKAGNASNWLDGNPYSGEM